MYVDIFFIKIAIYINHELSIFYIIDNQNNFRSIFFFQRKKNINEHDENLFH